jgi:hypothetical protein
MSTSAEQELRQRLSAVLDEMTPGPAPVGAVIRRGRGVRRRRIAGATAAALAAVAVVAGFSSLGLRLPSQAPAAPPPVVTVVPPGPGATAGLIASGRVGTRTWSARATMPSHGQLCVTAGPAGQFCTAVTRPVGPVSLMGLPTETDYRVLAGMVQPKVTRVDVVLADGQQLIMHPVVIGGRHWVAFAAPIGVKATRAVAYVGRAVYRYAIPFSEPGTGSFPAFATWLRPGQAGLPRETFLIASGTVLGHRWTVTEYTGPWGRCFVLPGASDCLNGGLPVIAAGRLTQPMFSVPGGVHMTAVSPNVASVALDLSSGQHVRVVTGTGLYGQRFYAFLLPHGVKVQGWTAYDSAGVKLGSGPGSTAG